MSNKKSVNKKSNPLLFVTIAVIVIALAVVILIPKGDDLLVSNETTTKAGSVAKEVASSDTAVAATLNENGDVVIQIADITETATFYSYESNGTAMGVFAVKSSDGTVRTALDTCQVCNGSPYAYFEQQGDTFQCKNCGNIYSLDMIEQERGGCNPVPVMTDEKIVTDTEIIIPAKVFEDNAARFENWKKF